MISNSQSDSPPLIYQPLPVLTKREDVEKLLTCGSIEELSILSLALGENFPNWKYAQDICILLSEHPDERVRANACLGFAYIARTQGQLEKYLIKPILLRELRTQIEFRWRIEDTIQDINFYLNWHLAHKHIN